MRNNFVKKLFWWVPFGRVPEITAEELHTLLDEGTKNFIMVDVRSRKEWEENRIKGSINLPITSLSSQYCDGVFDIDTLLITICRTAHRSIPGYRFFVGKGFKNVFQLQGGMESWWEKGLPTEKDQTRYGKME